MDGIATVALTECMCVCVCGLPPVVPHIMKQVRADKGAIPFVLSGANVMCPGLTSAGGEMPEELEAGTPVAIMAEGKELAMAIGILTLSTEEMYVCCRTAWTSFLRSLMCVSHRTPQPQAKQGHRH